MSNDKYKDQRIYNDGYKAGWRRFIELAIPLIVLIDLAVTFTIRVFINFSLLVPPLAVFAMLYSVAPEHRGVMIGATDEQMFAVIDANLRVLVSIALFLAVFTAPMIGLVPFKKRS